MKVCRICRGRNIQENYMQFQYASKDFSLAKCQDCKIVFYQNEFFFDFKKNFEHNRSIKTYLEKTSDLEGLITISYNFFNHLPDRTGMGVDIGCGVGIIMDFSEKVMGKKMIGFEPSSHYCKEGKETLKLNIIEDYFSIEYLESKKFDFAVCFQVLQMIDDPIKLLKDIKNVLLFKGVLLISTPDNEILNSKSNLPDHISALSPGVHRIIFSTESLEILLQKAGFTNIRIYKKNGQLFALASCNALPDIDLFKDNREIVLDYYETKLSEIAEDTSYFKGIWYRLYRNRIDHGEYKDALELLKGADWFEIWTEYEIEGIQTIDKLFALNSSSDAIIYYYTGILFLNHLGNYDYAEKFFLLSYLLSQKVIQLQPEMCVVESDIIWLAKLHNIIAKLYQGRVAEAKKELLSLIKVNQTNENALPKPSSEIISKAEKMIRELN